ncbi:MAG: histidine phosphatase family protein [Planctomycetes bacterium]|nr:histidine phosphatase family protein [Planctomycetota bacterium]
MLKIILLRPGSTEFDVQGRIVGTLDLPLSAEGNAEVATAIGALNGDEVAMVYCSPCQSAVETAEAVAAARGVKCKQIKTLQNVNYGLWQGMLVDEVRRKQPRVFKQWQEHPETICPPEGEMFADVQQRVEAALTKLLKKHKEGIIVLVVPEPLAGIARSRLQHTDLSEAWKTVGECGAWEAIVVQPGGQLDAKPALGGGVAHG